MTRHIDLEGVENFRDFGGYDTVCGRGLKRGRLYRSANHSYASEADLAAIQGLGIAVVVDLRRPQERTREPSRRWATFEGQVIESDLEGDHADWSVLLKQAETIDGRWFYEDSIHFYRSAPFEPRHKELFARYFHVLAETEGAVVVHCAAGKDRTGMICALTHHLAGVHRDDMLADFLATNNENRLEHRMGFLGPWIKGLTGRTVSDEALRVAVSVDAAYLEQAFAAMTAAHGSIDGYLEEALGIDAALRERIHERLLG